MLLILFLLLILILIFLFCGGVSMTDLLTTLRSGRVVLMDGAMGTELIRRGLPLNSCFEALNFDTPTLVQDVHRDYAQAGAPGFLDQHLSAVARVLWARPSRP